LPTDAVAMYLSIPGRAVCWTSALLAGAQRNNVTNIAPIIANFVFVFAGPHFMRCQK
jgi:hypothetical protein